MLTEERTAKFNNSIRVNWKTERERERETESELQVYVLHHQGNRESSEASVQHDFRGLLLWCQPVTTYRTAGVDTCWELQYTPWRTHAHTLYSIHRLSTLPSLHLTLLRENPQLKPTFKSRQYQCFEAHFVLSESQLIFTSLMSLQRAPRFFINWLNKTINSTMRQTSDKLIPPVLSGTIIIKDGITIGSTPMTFTIWHDHFSLHFRSRKTLLVPA